MSKKEKKKNSIKENKVIVENQDISTIVLDEENIKNENVDIKDTTDTSPSAETNSEEIINDDNLGIKDTEDITHSTETDSKEIIADKNLDITNEENEKEKNIDFVDDKHCNKKSNKTLFIISFSIFATALLLFIFSTIFALFASYNNNIIGGVKIKGIDISGLSKESAFEKVSSAFEKKLSEPFTLKHNEYELEVFPEQFDISFAINDAIDYAYSKGRSGNIFQNNYEILSSILFGININPSFSYSEENLSSLCTEMESNFSDRLIDSNYYIENNNLIISKGQDGIIINKRELLSEIAYFINNLYITNCVIDIPIEQKSATVLDLQKIHDEVYRAPQDAYYTTNPYVVHPHVDGIDFAISMEEATKVFSESPNQCVIPLKVLSPNITTNQIGPEAFPNLLGSYYTTFSTSNKNRSTNIRLATQKINGTVIMPGETFSYNQVVGKRTAAAGFKSAAVYSGGEVTTGIGGGICQVSSTLYNAVLLANLEIVERTNHGFNPGYVPAGRDATVSWGGPDFKFKNNRDYPIKIIAKVSGGKISIQIFGLKSNNDYEVEIESYITSYIKYKTITKNDSTLPKGKTKVIQNGSNGCKSVAYRILKQNGEIVSKTLLSKDTYNPHNKIVAVGTK